MPHKTHGKFHLVRRDKVIHSSHNERDCTLWSQAGDYIVQAKTPELALQCKSWNDEGVCYIQLRTGSG